MDIEEENENDKDKEKLSYFSGMSNLFGAWEFILVSKMFVIFIYNYFYS